MLSRETEIMADIVANDNVTAEHGIFVVYFLKMVFDSNFNFIFI